MGEMDAAMILKLVCAFFIPPLAVFLHKQELGLHFFINIVLCFFFWIPAIIHALWFIFAGPA